MPILGRNVPGVMHRTSYLGSALSPSDSLVCCLLSCARYVCFVASLTPFTAFIPMMLQVLVQQ